MFTLKVSFAEDTRSIQFAKLPPYDILRVLLTNLFEGLALNKEFVVQYFDDEGDVISVKSDLELQEAHRLIGNNSTLHLYVSLAGSVLINKRDDDEKEISIENVVHENVIHENMVHDNVNLDNSNLQNEMLTKIEEEVLTIFSNLGKYIHDLDLQKQLNQALHKWDNSLDYAQSVCKNTYTNIKTTVQNKSDHFTLDNQIKRIREKICKLTLEMTTLVNQLPTSPSPLPYPYPLPTIDDFEIIPSDVSSNPSSLIYPSLSDSLPPDAASKDLRHLEQMGFLDRSRNLELLAKHKGDMAAVIEALLS